MRCCSTSALRSRCSTSAVAAAVFDCGQPGPSRISLTVCTYHISHRVSLGCRSVCCPCCIALSPFPVVLLCCVAVDLTVYCTALPPYTQYIRRHNIVIVSIQNPKKAYHIVHSSDIHAIAIFGSEYISRAARRSLAQDTVRRETIQDDMRRDARQDEESRTQHHERNTYKYKPITDVQSSPACLPASPLRLRLAFGFAREIRDPLA